MRIIRFLFMALVFAASIGTAAAQNRDYQLSTHILDIGLGKPAAGVTIYLYRMDADGGWTKAGEGVTDTNGRISDFLPGKNNDGVYKLRFETEPYFQAQNLPTIYPFVEVVFSVEGEGHYHIPITMSANGYATYRGN